MSDTAENLLTEILGNARRMAINNCPGVPTEIGRVVYGTYQNDSKGLEISNDHTKQRNINEAIWFSGSKTDTAVWHFSTAPTVHHFVVIPWYKPEPPFGQAYAVLMAYENKYTLGEYVNGTGHFAPVANAEGFKHLWTAKQLSEMLSELLDSNTGVAAWKKYFDRTGNTSAQKITCYKYKVIPIKKAIENVKKF